MMYGNNARVIGGDIKFKFNSDIDLTVTTIGRAPFIQKQSFLARIFEIPKPLVQYFAAYNGVATLCKAICL